MSARTRLPDRRLAEHFGFICNGQSYVCSVGRFSDGQLAEVFVTAAKVGSHSDVGVKDAAIITSIALQFGVPLAVLCRAVLRDASGAAASAIGCALDLIQQQQERGK